MSLITFVKNKMIDFLKKNGIFIEKVCIPLFPISLIVLDVLLHIGFYISSTGASHFLKILSFLGAAGWAMGVSRQRNNLSVMLQIFLIAVLGMLAPSTVIMPVTLGIIYVVIIRICNPRLKWLKRLAYISLVFPLVFILFLGYLLSAFFEDFGKTTKVKSIDSPNGNYQLNLWDNDAGAMGGSTSVSVERNYGNILMHKIQVYRGRWGDHPNIQWIDNEHIAINDKTIDITRNAKWGTKWDEMGGGPR